MRAQSIPEWSTLEVRTKSGAQIIGRLTAVDATSLSLTERGVERTIPRDSIASIRRRTPNTRAAVIGGAVTGAILGGLLGAAFGYGICEVDCGAGDAGAGATIGLLAGTAVGGAAGYTAGAVFPKWKSISSTIAMSAQRKSHFLTVDRCEGRDAAFHGEAGVTSSTLVTSRASLGLLCEPGTIGAFELGTIDIFDVHSSRFYADVRGNYTTSTDYSRHAYYGGFVADRSFSFLPAGLRVVTAVDLYRFVEHVVMEDRDDAGQLIPDPSRSQRYTTREIDMGFGLGLSARMLQRGPVAMTADVRTHFFRGFAISTLSVGASYRPK